MSEGPVLCLRDASRHYQSVEKRQQQLKRWKISSLASESSDIRSETKVSFDIGVRFRVACYQDDYQEAEKHLKEGADVNSANEDGLTALHQATLDQNIEMITFLLDNNADIDAQDCEGWTPLHAAATLDDFPEVVSLLLSRGANPCILNYDGEFPIDISPDDGCLSTSLLSKAMENNITDIDKVKNMEHNLMLEDASRWQRIGYNPDGPDNCIDPNTGATPLHVAAAKGYTDVLNILVECRGVDLEAKDNDGWTALHAAVHFQNRDAIRHLIDAGSNIETTSYSGLTPIDLADDETRKYITRCKQMAGVKLRNPRRLLDGMAHLRTNRRSSVIRLSMDQKSLIRMQKEVSPLAAVMENVLLKKTLSGILPRDKKETQEHESQPSQVAEYRQKMLSIIETDNICHSSSSSGHEAEHHQIEIEIDDVDKEQPKSVKIDSTDGSEISTEVSIEKDQHADEVSYQVFQEERSLKGNSSTFGKVNSIIESEITADKKRKSDSNSSRVVQERLSLKGNSVSLTKVDSVVESETTTDKVKSIDEVPSRVDLERISLKDNAPSSTNRINKIDDNDSQSAMSNGEDNAFHSKLHDDNSLTEEFSSFDNKENRQQNDRVTAGASVNLDDKTESSLSSKTSEDPHMEGEIKTAVKLRRSNIQSVVIPLTEPKSHEPVDSRHSANVVAEKKISTIMSPFKQTESETSRKFFSRLALSERRPTGAEIPGIDEMVKQEPINPPVENSAEYYKALLEQEKAKCQMLQEQVEHLTKEHDIQVKTIERLSEGDEYKKRIEELENENATLKQKVAIDELKQENEKLRTENRTLLRVISKLSTQRKTDNSKSHEAAMQNPSTSESSSVLTTTHM